MALLLAVSPVAARAAAGDRLLLELWIDGRNTGSVVTVTPQDTHLLVSREALMQAGLNVDGTGLNALKSYRGNPLNHERPSSTREGSVKARL